MYGTSNLQILDKIDEISKRKAGEVGGCKGDNEGGLKDKLVEDALKCRRQSFDVESRQIAGISLQEFIEVLKEKRIEIQYGIREFE